MLQYDTRHMLGFLRLLQQLRIGVTACQQCAAPQGNVLLRRALGSPIGLVTTISSRTNHAECAPTASPCAEQNACGRISPAATMSHAVKVISEVQTWCMPQQHGCKNTLSHSLTLTHQRPARRRC